MASEWRTVDELQAGKRAIVESMPGWSEPAAYALGVRTGDREIDFRVTNHRGTHDLPGIVLAHVLGYRTGTRSYILDLATFDVAIAELEPAGACDAYDHPNLWAWQQLRAEIETGDVPRSAEIVAVFIGDESQSPVGAPVVQLRRQLGID